VAWPAWYGRLVRRVYDGMVALSLTLAGCFTDNGAGVSGPGPSTSGATTGEPGVTTGDPGVTTGSTCAGACGETVDPTTPGSTGTGDTTGGSTTEDPTTGGAHPTFTAAVNLFLEGAYALARGSYDDDGQDDLVITSRDLMTPSLYVVHGPGNGVIDTFDLVAAISVVAPDLDGDGDSDIVLGQLGAPAVVHTYMWDQGQLTGSAIALPAQCVGPRRLASGLVDGDINIDLVIACDAGGIVILPGMNGGEFGAPLQLNVGGVVVGVALADVTSDDFLDLIYLDDMNASVVVFRGAGSFNYDANKSSSFAVDEPSAVAVGHLDDDAFLDFMVASGSDCSTFRGTDSAPILGPVHACGVMAQDLQLADLDEDGVDDVVTVHSGELHIGYGAGDGTFSASEVLAADVMSARAAIGDYNGDSRLDIAVTGMNSLMLFLQSQ